MSRTVVTLAAGVQGTTWERLAEGKGTMRTRTAYILLLLALAADPVAARHDDIPDPPASFVSAGLPTGLRLDPKSVTVSGLSAGGFFAHQFHIAYSELVSGAAILAGGPYGCVDVIDNPLWPFRKLDRTSAAVVACTHTFGDQFWGLRPRPPNAADSMSLIGEAYLAGMIDDPKHLTEDRVWLFRGDLDPIVPADVADSLASLYRLLGIRGDALKIEVEESLRRAGHGIPVARTVQNRFTLPDCGETEFPFLNACGHDAAALLLHHLYPNDFRQIPVDAHETGSLSAFDQSKMFIASPSAGLSDVGYIYVPYACQSEECRLHVAFHGCRQNVDAKGDERVHDDVIRDAGYNHWAASNRIVVIYPQATVSEGNPMACWDFWGYSGDEWRTRHGVQMRAIAAIIDQLLTR